MTAITCRAGSPAFIAMLCVGASFSPLAPAVAQQATAAEKPKALGGVTVTDDVLVDEAGTRQESPKATRPVRDTPQTVTILTREVVEMQNLLTLRDVLSTVPGITFGAGEGGGGFGDSINFRGYSANNDITIDGVRDSAQYTRSDTFNLDQIEVTNGANSAVAGSGSVGGSINIVTKRPTAKDATTITAGVGLDNYFRGTIDTNKRVSDQIAVRLNAMVHQNDIPGRDVETMKRWGVAPSVTFGIDGPTQMTVQYVHQEDKNIPQYGVPYYAVAGGMPAGVDRKSYYGYRNIDKQDINVDSFTTIFSHEFSDKVNIRNLTRYQDVTQDALNNPPQGTYCLASTNLTPLGASCGTVPAGFFLPSGPRGTTRDSRNQLAYNQTDLRAVFNTGGIEHTLTLGASAGWEKYNLASGNSLRNADGSVAFATFPLINIATPNVVVQGPGTSVFGSNVYTGPVNFIHTARQEGEMTNYAAYVFDTAKLGDHFELSGALRYEHTSGKFRSDTISAVPATLGVVTTGPVFHNSANLFSYRAGLNYKPVEAISIYAAYGNSKTPSQTSVNGSCSTATCNVKPETAKNYEVGIKAEVAAGVLLTAALFRNERDQYKVASLDPSVPDQQLDGASRVNGVSLGATGNITPTWSVSGNYTYLDSKVIRSIAANTPTGGTSPNDAQAGNPLTATPAHSGSLFTNYKFPFGLGLGYGVTYQGSFYLSNSVTVAVPVLLKSEGYFVHSAVISYDLTRRLSAQLNIKNFTDKLYFTRIRNNGWATPGDGRTAVIALAYKF